MVLPDRLYIDTNIFIRLFEGRDDVETELGFVFLREPVCDPAFLLTSELTLAELLVEPVRRNDGQMISRYDGWTTSNQFLEVRPVDRWVLWSAAVLRAAYATLKLPDAIHLATALLTGCSHFLTADGKLRGTYELSLQHWGLRIGPASVAIVRPEVGYLQSLTGRTSA
jgi:predicted nucleic acid-binding protein